MAFSANYENTYNFSVTGDTYAEIEEAAKREARRYYGEATDFTILKIAAEPVGYSYSQHGSHREPRTPMVADVFTRMREPIEGRRSHGASRRTTREDRRGRTEE